MKKKFEICKSRDEIKIVDINLNPSFLWEGIVGMNLKAQNMPEVFYH